MKKIYAKVIKDIYDQFSIVVFEQGELGNPILILSHSEYDEIKKDITRQLKEWRTE